MIDVIAGFLEGSRFIIPTLLNLVFIASFSIILIYIITQFDFIRKQFTVKKSFWILLFLIFLLGLGLRISTPVFYSTYYDELLNVEVSKNIILRGQPLVCEYTTPEKILCQPSIFPTGFSYVLSVFLFLFGISMNSAYIAAAVMGSFVAVLITISVYMIFKNEKIALWSGFSASIFPLFILHSRTLEDDTLFLLSLLLALFAFALLLKGKNVKTGVFAVTCLAFAFSLKQEGLLLLPLFCVFLILYFESSVLKRVYKNRKFWYCAILFVVLVTPHIIYLSAELYPALFYGKDTGLTPRGFLSLENVGSNTWIFARFAGVHYPLIFNLFAIVGLLYSIKKFRKELIFMSLLFFSFLFIYLTYSGGIHERYMITVYLPLITMGGVGIFLSEKIICNLFLRKAKLVKFSRQLSYAISFSLMLIIILSFLPFLYKLDDTMPLESPNGFSRDEIFYQENIYVESISKEIGNSYIVSDLSTVFAGTNMKPVRTESFLPDYENKNPQEIFSKVYYFEDLFCSDFYTYGERCWPGNESFEKCDDFRNYKINMCKAMHQKFELVPFLEYNFNVSENIRIRYKSNTSIVSFRVYEISGVKNET